MFSCSQKPSNIIKTIDKMLILLGKRSWWHCHWCRQWKHLKEALSFAQLMSEAMRFATLSMFNVHSSVAIIFSSSPFSFLFREEALVCMCLAASLVTENLLSSSFFGFIELAFEECRRDASTTSIYACISHFLQMDNSSENCLLLHYLHQYWTTGKARSSCI